MKRTSFVSSQCRAMVILLAALTVSCNLGRVADPGYALNDENAVLPKPGFWEGKTEAAGEASISFHLSASGEITDYVMKAAFGTPVSSCEITLDRAQLELDKDAGTFVISYLMDYEAVEEQLGAAVMSLGVIPKGEPYEVLRIEGTATASTLNGTYTVRVCGSALYFGSNTGPWNPQWKSP